MSIKHNLLNNEMETKLISNNQKGGNSKKFKKRKEKSDILDCPLIKAVKFLHCEDY